MSLTKNKVISFSCYETVGVSFVNPSAIFGKIDRLLKTLYLAYNKDALSSKCNFNSGNDCCKNMSYLAIGHIKDNNIRVSGACEQHYYILSAKGYLKDTRIMYKQEEVNKFIDMANTLC